MNFISCIKWVKQGVAKSVPDIVHLDENELKKLVEATNTDDEEGEPSTVPKSDDEDVEPSAVSSDDEYDFKNYDNDDDLRISLKGIAAFDSNQKTKKRKRLKDDSDSEKEDEIIKENDNLLLVGHVDDDFSTLDIYVYNSEDNDMYIHHDIVLQSPPLCVEWLNIPSVTESGNICAIGSLNPVIEIWDLDIINCVEPLFKLGRHKKKKPEKNYGHSDAVLSLAWNYELTHILASGSVDNTVLLWDLDNCKVATEITSFNDKVQALSWNPFSPHYLLTGCADQNLRNFDCRVYDDLQICNLNSAIESIYWDPRSEFCCFAGTEDGNVYYIDWKMGNKPIWNFQAHSKEVTGLAMNSDRKKLITISTDESIKFWNSEEEKNLLRTKDLKLGSLHCIDINPNYPHLACVGGSSEKHDRKILQVINLDEEINREEIKVPVKIEHPETIVHLLEKKGKDAVKNKKEKKMKKKIKNVNERRKKNQMLRSQKFAKIKAEQKSRSEQFKRGINMLSNKK